MKTKKSLIITALAFLLVMAAAVTGYSIVRENTPAEANYSNETAENKTRAADFVVYDREGEEVRLSDMQGKPMVVNFWVSYCFPCTSELPAFQDAYDRYKDEVTFMMIDKADGVKETLKMANSYLEKKGYTFPVYFDTEGDAFSKLRAFGVPMTFFIDSEGNIVSYASGEISAEELEERIKQILE